MNKTIQRLVDRVRRGKTDPTPSVQKLLDYARESSVETAVHWWLKGEPYGKGKRVVTPRISNRSYDAAFTHVLAALVEIGAEGGPEQRDPPETAPEPESATTEEAEGEQPDADTPEEADSELPDELPEGVERPVSRLRTPKAPEGVTHIGNAPIVQWEDGMTAEAGNIYLGMPNDAYHCLPGISNSGLSRFARSPAHYMLEPDRKSTRPMEIGTAIHTAVLEPELFDREYVIVDVNNRTRKLYRDVKKELGGVNGELALTRNEGAQVLGMQGAMLMHPHIGDLLQKDGFTELTIVASVGPTPDHIIRCKLDKLAHTDAGQWVGVDIKKARDARTDGFAKAAYDYRYHVQAAFYEKVFELATGQKLDGFYFAAIEDAAPHGCNLFACSEGREVVDPDTGEVIREYGFMDHGRAQLKRDLRAYIEAVEGGDWHCYDELPKVIHPPRWADMSVLTELDNE